MSENVDVLRRGYDAFNNRDPQALASVFAEDVGWEGTDDQRVPGGGTFDGRDAALGALAKAIEPFEDFWSSPEELIESGDTVVVVGRTAGLTHTGKTVSVPFVHVWRMEDAVIKRGQLVTDTAAVLAALEG